MLTLERSRSAPSRNPVPPVEAPPLRVLSDAELAEARRRRRARRIFIGAVALVATGLFGVVVAHVMLMQGQFELQNLQARTATAQAEYDRLRLQVSELESPDRIVAVAQEKLGMVAPPKITYLAPSSEPAALPAATIPEDDDGRGRTSAAPAAWSSVKSHLAGG